MTENVAKLAAALVKAQSGFGTVKRDKTVTVQKKTGGSYSFSYAPLDSILEAVRKPLADNGLVVVQLLDGGALETFLLHESGERLGGSVMLPADVDIQGYGSAITYMRRYAIQALLGIAAEEDDDGNRSLGNETGSGASHEPVLMGNITKSGTFAKGNDKAGYGAEWRETPNGHAIGLRMKVDDRDIPQVLITDTVGEAVWLATGGDPIELIGRKATVKGKLYGVSAPGRATYYRLVIGEYPDSDFIETSDWRVPAAVAPVEATETAGEPVEAVSVPLPFDAADMADVDGVTR